MEALELPPSDKVLSKRDKYCPGAVTALQGQDKAMSPISRQHSDIQGWTHEQRSLKLLSHPPLTAFGLDISAIPPTHSPRVSPPHAFPWETP